MEGKRKYTVPILLVIITGLTIVSVLLYSRLLLARQADITEEGKRLAERYTYATAFAFQLHEGADLLLKASTEAQRLKAKALIGQGSFAFGETLGLLTEASYRSTGLPRVKVFKPISDAMMKITSEQGGNLYAVGEHEGPLTDEEKDMLRIVSEGTARMKKALLDNYHPPTGDAGYRNMAAGSDWVQPALEAAKALEETASRLK